MMGPYREPGVPAKHFKLGQYVRINDLENIPTPIGIVIGKDVLESGRWLVMSLWGMPNTYSVRTEKMEDVPTSEYDQSLIDQWLYDTDEIAT